MNLINYKLLHESTVFYEAHGFKRIEVPWTVTKEISAITKPADRKDFELVHEDNKVLVASAEQSFLYLYAKGHLPAGSYQGLSPCFRKEPITIDPTTKALHSKYFLKNELNQTDATSISDLKSMIDVAFAFFKQYCPEEHLKVVPTGTDTYDIEFHGIELGSYGIRECSFVKWIYGTGVAENRFSNALYQHGITVK